MAAHYQRLIKASLEEEVIDGHPADLYAPMRYMLNLGGKRMRPMLVLLGYALFRADVEAIIRPALSVELLHNFTLIHDDVMDEAPLRRGKASVHARWNINTAILSGDALLIKGYTMFSDIDKTLLSPILHAFNDCALRVCEGQQIDLCFESTTRVSEKDYLEMIRLKTGYLLGFCLELGALLANAKAEMIVKMRQLGQQIGIMFQLKDDLLDIYGETAAVGKRIGGDIISNKKTFLLLCALQRAKGDMLAQLKAWLSRADFDENEKVESVRAIYDHLNVKTYTEAFISDLYEDCKAQLSALSVDKKPKEALEAYLESLFFRTS